MKIVITGGKGQLGNQLKQILESGKSQLGDIPSVYKKNQLILVDVDDLDITNFKDVEDFLNTEKPDLVINSAAMTNVDGCEENKELAFKVNALGARNLAVCCEHIGAKLVQVSTDYVFEGTGNKPYTEYDIPNPASVYGKTKYAGEQYVRDFCSRYFIVRTAWLYGEHGNNFVKTIMKLANEKESIKVVNDQLGNPTYAEDLSYHILKIAATEQYGVFNCTCEGTCSWYDFACEIVKLSGINCNVEPCTTEEFPRPAKRPAFSSLDKMMLRCTVGNEMRSWQDAIKCFMNNIK